MRLKERVEVEIKRLKDEENEDFVKEAFEHLIDILHIVKELQSDHLRSEHE